MSSYIFNNRKLWRRLIQRILLIGISGLVLCAPQGIAGTAKGPLMLEVTKVYPSPGFWTGMIEAIQWIDVTVKYSSNSSYKIGSSLRVGIQVVKGSKLFNPDTRSFYENQVGVGRLLAVKTRGNCLYDISAAEFKVEPSCIRAVVAERELWSRF